MNEHTAISAPESIEAKILNDIREWLKSGAVISAVDPQNVLQLLPDGTVHGGMYVDFDQNAKSYLEGRHT